MNNNINIDCEQKFMLELQQTMNACYSNNNNIQYTSIIPSYRSTDSVAISAIVGGTFFR